MDKIKGDIISFIIRIVASVLGFTWRYKIVKMAEFEEPAIFAIWHKHILPMAFYYKNKNMSCIASGSRDGKRLSAILQKWGFRTVLGSSGHGGKRALIGGLKELAEYKHSLIVTPDGPTGPPEEAKPGILFFAKKSGRSTVVITFDISSCWRLGTWDGLVIPKPFSRIMMNYDVVKYKEEADDTFLKTVSGKLDA